MAKIYEPTLAVTSLANKLSGAVAGCLREEKQSASQNLEAMMLCCSIMATHLKLSKTAENLWGMAGAVDQLRKLSEGGPIEIDSKPRSVLDAAGLTEINMKNGSRILSAGGEPLRSIRMGGRGSNKTPADAVGSGGCMCGVGEEPCPNPKTGKLLCEESGE